MTAVLKPTAINTARMFSPELRMGEAVQSRRERQPQAWQELVRRPLGAATPVVYTHQHSLVVLPDRDPSHINGATNPNTARTSPDVSAITLDNLLGSAPAQRIL